ncbi:hypothetical protein PENTCL1PPCAC_23758, partial [Pristionchus entomophagus]
ILRHKKWHVRTKDNMARVRKDVKKAEEEEKAVLDREILATNEARLSALRKNADTRMDTMFGVRRAEDEGEPGPSFSGGHINFFAELEQQEAKNVGDTNKEYEEDKKKEQFAWEAKMGIQMKLGDDGNEGKGYWFDKIPLRRGIKEMKKIEEEQAMREKMEEKMKAEKEKRKRKAKDDSDETSEDEEKEEKRRKDKKKKKEKEKKRKNGKKEKKDKKKKKRKKNSSSSESEDEEEMKRREEAEKKEKLQQLRDERMKRERVEQAKTQLILHPELARKKEEEAKKNAPKYNSGFNPHLAR